MHLVSFSQSFDTLLDKLKIALYEKPTFLAPQTVIVGSEEMKQKVMFAISSDLSLDCLSAVQVISKDKVTDFLRRFFLEKKPLSRAMVSLLIEEYLRNSLENDPLLSLINIDPQKRLPVFAEKLSELFMKYALFSPDFFKKSNNFISLLFAKVQNELDFKILDEEYFCDHKVSSKLNLHIFCCRYFPPKYVKIFKKISEKSPVHSYVLSPSGHFWEDFLSDYEEKKFLKKLTSNKEAHKELIQDKHPLLANFGVLKREYLKTLIQDFAQTFEYYDEKEPTTLLEHLRFDLLHLNKEKKVLSKDDSLQVYKTRSKLEEVLLVKEQIDATCKDIPYNQIAVYCPDTSVYAPFIEMVFGPEIKIYGKSLKSSSYIAQGILDLLSLYEEGITISTFRRLLLNPSFQSKQDFSKEEIQRITRWFSAVNLHRNLEDSRFDKLIFGLIYFVDKELFSKTYPMFGIEMGDAELLNKLVFVVSKLKDDILYFQQNRFLDEYILRLKESEEFYFSEVDNKILSAELNQYSSDFFLNKKIPFVSLLYRIQASLGQKKISLQSNKIGLPTFSSLKNNLCSSFEKIFLIGMSESFFTYRKDPLDPMEYSSYTPSQKDQDHAFILEALLLAKKSLVLAFSEPYEGESLALMVQELFSHLDSYYSIEGILPSNALVEEYENKAFVENQLPTLEMLGFEQDQEILKEYKVQDLLFFAKQPIKYYFQKVLQIDLEKSLLGKIEENYDFSMSAKDKALFKHLLLKQGIKKTEDEFEKLDKLPLPFIYKTLSHDFVTQEKEIVELLEKFSLKRENFTIIDLQKKPLIISYLDVSIKLKGILEVHDRGFILPDDQLEKVIRIWPSILIYACHFNVKVVELYFIKEKAKKVLQIEDPEKQLSLYLEYFFSAQKSPSPLLSFFVKSLLLKDEDDFIKKFEQVKNLQFNDPYMEIFSSKYDLRDVYQKWEKPLKNTFQAFLESYECADATF